MVNGIDFLISVSDFSLLVYRKASDFCVLIVDPVTLLTLLIGSSNFLIENSDTAYIEASLGFSLYSIMSFANSESCTTTLPIPFLFFFFSSLIAIAKNLKIMLNNGDKSGHPFLVPDIQGNAYSFSSLRIMFAIGSGQTRDGKSEC